MDALKRLLFSTGKEYDRENASKLAREDNVQQALRQNDSYLNYL
ncbi:MAG: hypothetical protein ACQEQG_10700 [Bacillota bacterium]